MQGEFVVASGSAPMLTRNYPVATSCEAVGSEELGVQRNATRSQQHGYQRGLQQRDAKDLVSNNAIRN